MARVVAAAALPAGALTPALSTEELQTLVCADAYGEQTLYVRGAPLSLPAWCVRARLAPHEPASSLLLSRERGAWRVRCRGAPAGAELRVWFAPDLLAEVRMPFLTPRNIRGKKNYTCHECEAQFEEPNPLKVHLFLSCKPYSGTRFWAELLRRCAEPPASDVTRLARPWEPRDVTELGRRGHVTQACHTADVAVDLLGHRHAALAAHWTADAAGGAGWGAAAEALAAAWARAGAAPGAGGAGGHRCVYCGRRYSRAYGLKIHVRTHTGYKPLRCPVCARAFGDPSNLNKHVRLHARHERYERHGRHACAACGKLLARRRDLERHMRTRHALSPAGGGAEQASQLEL